MWHICWHINIKHPSGGFNLDGKIKASNFVQKKGEEHKKSDLVANPVMKLPTAEHFLMKSDKLKTSAKNNTQKDFEFSYFDDINDALIEGLSQNQDFFSLLLKNDEIKHQVLGIFSDEIYKGLKKS